MKKILVSTVAICFVVSPLLTANAKSEQTSFDEYHGKRILYDNTNDYKIHIFEHHPKDNPNVTCVVMVTDNSSSSRQNSIATSCYHKEIKVALPTPPTLPVDSKTKETVEEEAPRTKYEYRTQPNALFPDLSK